MAIFELILLDFNAIIPEVAETVANEQIVDSGLRRSDELREGFIKFK